MRQYRSSEITKHRWEIEEYFRIMKSKFKARSVYLSRDERIPAHFMACLLSSILYRMFERRLKIQFNCEENIAQLREMNFPRIKISRYVLCYTRIDFTDALYETLACGRAMHRSK